MFKTRIIICALAGVMATAACSTSDDSDGDSVGGTTDVADVVEQDTPTVADVPAIDTTPDPSCTAEWTARFTGQVVDESGDAVAGAKAQLCIRVAPNDILRCLSPVDTDSTGAFVADVPETLRCTNEATLRALAPGADRATMYCHVEIDGRGPIVAIDPPLVLYSTVRATDLPAIGDSATERTVAFSDGLEVDVVPDQMFITGDGYDRLAASRLDDIAADLCFLDGTPVLVGLYAFSPEGDVSGDNFSVRIPNTTGLAAESSVSFYVLGGLDTRLPDDTVIPEATWQQYGTGVVSSDGSTVNGDLPYFSWLGYRAQ